MEHDARDLRHAVVARLMLLWVGVVLGVLPALPAHAFTLTVQGCDANNVCTPLSVPFQYLVEEDNTTLTVPQTIQVNPPSATLAIHKSHAPVVTSGASATAVTAVNIPNDKRYFVSVMPDPGYLLNGAPVAVGQGNVTVFVAQAPLPTAQISVFVHIDHSPINNTWDEHDGGPGLEATANPPPLNGGLGGASVTISDYAGKVLTDYLGNPLGTRYDANLNVTQIGTGVIKTMTVNDVDDPAKNPYNVKVGEALIKYLAPGKYGITVVPPQSDDGGNPMTWVQTSTIEGTRTIDAWVKADEPRLFIEGFGQGFNHASFGFIKVSPTGESQIAGQTVKALPWNLPSGDPDYVNRSGFTGSISGTVRVNHFSRPPNLQGYFPGPPVDKCWVGLNTTVVQPGLLPTGLYAAPCDPTTGQFTISNVPPGSYQLVYWDEPLQMLFGFATVNVPAGGSGTGAAVSLGNVLAFSWFGTFEGSVFFDPDQNGFRGAGETGVPGQAVNLRFRDGSMYQSVSTDLDGKYKFEEVFPFFTWLVSEVDFARFKPTGMTAAIDYGGQVPDLASPVWPTNGNKALQPQSLSDPANDSGTTTYRTETGPVLLEAQQIYLGQTNLVDWGKTPYGPGENGGITGIVYYSVTRAENNPRYGTAETWEPGIPRVQVCLYRDTDNNAVIDDVSGNSVVDLCDVDNYPYGWSEGGAKGDEDVKRNTLLGPTTFSLGDALERAVTDSWDDANPSGCVQTLPVVHGQTAPECADSFGTWNQVRPGVFDGGYAFGFAAGNPNPPDGTYIVESVMPPHYGIVREEDKNVAIGEPIDPSPLLLPPVCVGTPANAQPLHTVPPYYTLFQNLPIDPPLAGSVTPLCNMKQVLVKQGQNTAADFQFVTDVPKAARVFGFVLNDLTAEFNAGSPVFGEKLAARWIPVSFKDWTGREITRVYADEWGTYNALLPSTYNVNIPMPSGVSPRMITLVLNDPVLPNGQPDPYYDPTYAVSPWTLNYTPGKTTYADTPIVPIRAFAASGVGFSTAASAGTPTIRSVDGPGAGVAPLLCSNLSQTTVTLTSMGPTVVLDPVTGTNVTRDYGFGALGSAPNQGRVTLNGTALSITSWTDSTIVATVPPGATSGTLMVTRSGAGGLTSQIGVNLQIVNCATTTVRNVPSAYPTIQAAIDAASAGDIVLVAPGTYNENVIMHKPVRLQGSGAGSTFINANPIPLSRLQYFHQRLDAMGARNFAAYLVQDPFSTAEAPGVFVIGETFFPRGTLQNELAPVDQVLNPGNPFNVASLIDGFTILGSKAGGGIFAVAGASNLVISNNNITNNQGNFAGGIGIGTANVGASDLGFDSRNYNIVIRNNKIHANGGVDGAGGIALNNGTGSYLVEKNLITGNMSRFNGGGIAHNGFSPGNNVIRGNRILFNEVFFGAYLNLAGDGGGIFVGDPVVGLGSNVDAVPTEGAGNVTIDGNLIQGNLTGAGSGAGIRAFAVNSGDVQVNPANDVNWYRLNIVNNIIVNNVAALSGAGISLQDVLRARIINNTIANNDTTATAELAFAAGASNSTPQPAGVVSAPHTATLQSLITRPGEPTFSNPQLLNNIIWHNRSFFNNASLNSGAGGLAPRTGTGAPYWDLGFVSTVGTPPTMNPDDSILSSLTGPNGENYNDGSNIATATPGFVLGYSNVLQTASVIDEGGNNINVRYTPLDPAAGDYHVTAGSAGVNQGSNAAGVPTTDFDGQTRPLTASNAADIGADEVPGPAGPPTPTLPVLSLLDNFNRANANTLGANWQQLVTGGASGVRVNANQGFCTGTLCPTGTAATAGAYAYWNGAGAVLGSTQAAEFTFANTTLTNVGLVLKASGTFGNGRYQNMVRVRYNTVGTVGVAVDTTTNGNAATPTWTTRGTVASTLANGDRLTALVNASGAVFIWKTSGATTTYLGQVSLPATAVFTTGGGRVGLRLTPGASVDNFGGGNVAP